MTIPDLLRRVAFNLTLTSQCAKRRSINGLPDPLTLDEDATDIRPLAERLERPTEEMVEAAMGHASAGCHGVSEEGEKMRSTCESWMGHSIIAAITAAGEGL